MVVALPISESALPMDEISFEASINHFSVRQDQPACALLAVLPKLALVTHPVVLHLVEVSTVERTLQRQWVFIVEYALPVELALCPHAVICWSSLTIVQDAPPTDFPLLELTLVICPIGEEQLTPPVLLPSQQLTLVGASLLVFPLEKLYLLQTIPHPACLHFILLFEEALLAGLEVLELILETEFRDRKGGCSGGEDMCTGWGELYVSNGVED